MKIKQIRNATIIVKYGNARFLIDPFLGEKGKYMGFPGTINSFIKNPTVSLPLPLEEIIKDLDAVILTHLHLDHFDDIAKEKLDKNLKIFVQNEREKKLMEEFGFKNLEVLKEDGNIFKEIKLYKTLGSHGPDKKIQELPFERRISFEVSGIVMKNRCEKTLYIAGDTIYCNKIEKNIEKFKPEIVVVNGGDAKFEDGTSIIMNKEDIKNVSKKVNYVVVSHMEALNHCILTRKKLKSYLLEENIKNVLVPYDGEECKF